MELSRSVTGLRRPASDRATLEAIHKSLETGRQRKGAPSPRSEINRRTCTELTYAVLIAYFATMIAVGFAYSRQMKSLDMYFAGGKQLSWWLGGISFMMAYVSALSIVVYAGLGYQYGLVALTIYWTTVPATLVTTWLLARRWRRAGVLTPMEFLETRFSSSVRQVFVVVGYSPSSD